MDQMEIPAVEAHEEELELRRQAQDAARERECVEQVFGLTGGELEDEPWVCENVARREDFQPDFHEKFRYWYDGVPDYLGRQTFPDLYDVPFRTIVSTHSDTPEVLEDEDGRWYRVNSWGSSGETECPWNQAEEAEENIPCDLCEAQEGEEHGHIYLGDGWCEVVYKQDVVREVLES